MFKKNKLIEYLLYIFIFIPYLTSFTKKIDTSVYALLYSLFLAIFYINRKLPKELVYLFLLFILSLMLLVLNTINFSALRSVAGYLSIFIIASSTYHVLKLSKSVNMRLIYNITILWFVVGLIQILVDPSFMTFLVERHSTSITRGVIALAPEPTYYATVAIFLFLVSYITNYKINKILIMTLIMILFFAKSSTGLLLFGIYFILYIFIFILNRKIFTILMVFSVFIFILILSIHHFSNDRFYYIFEKLLNNPEKLFVIDASGNARMWNVVASFMGAYKNYFLPHGYDIFKENLLYFLNRFPNFVNPYTVSIASNKIMSGTGQMVFELGFISIVYLYSFFSLCIKAFHNIKKSIFITLAVFLVMTTAVPLTFPIFGFLYGLLAFYAYRGYNSENITNQY